MSVYNYYTFSKLAPWKIIRTIYGLLKDEEKRRKRHNRGIDAMLKEKDTTF